MVQTKFVGHLEIPTGEAFFYKKFDYLIDFKKGKFSTFFEGEETKHESFETLKTYVNHYLTSDIAYKNDRTLFGYEDELFSDYAREITKFVLVLDKIKPRSAN